MADPGISEDRHDGTAAAASSSAGPGAPPRGSRTAYLTPELLLQPAAELQEALTREWSELSAFQQIQRHHQEATFRMRRLAQEASEPPGRTALLQERLAAADAARTAAQAAVRARLLSPQPADSASASAPESRCETTAAAAAAGPAAASCPNPPAAEEEGEDEGERDDREDGSGDGNGAAEPASPSLSSVRGDGHDAARTHDPRGMFVAVATAYQTREFLLAPPEALRQAAAAEMCERCGSFESVRFHCRKAQKRLQALADAGELDAEGLAARLGALSEARRSANVWTNVARLLTPQLLTEPPRALVAALRVALRKKTTEEVEQLGVMFCDALRRLASSGQHPAPGQLAAQLAAVRTTVVACRPLRDLLLGPPAWAEEGEADGGEGEAGSAEPPREAAAKAGEEGQGALGAVEAGLAEAGLAGGGGGGGLAAVLLARWQGQSGRVVRERAEQAEKLLLAGFAGGSLDRATCRRHLAAVAAARRAAVAEPAAAAAADGDSDGAESGDDADDEGEADGGAGGPRRCKPSDLNLEFALRPPAEVRAVLWEMTRGMMEMHAAVVRNRKQV
ncbi:hypothetical protein GPECTOR_301g820 [Gonium pectorale]|uniref:Uncharacterized protein n=1 Tax=Gonium pectorale TaxID=33097 RepID=A0A150FVV3_GONPE|nr:hypothetical protein GPECTOR_301g820 [Gonium pectorale]|eukprot:KXZ41736.1 hypothetical protein GPECTOR_301g820 [Gonium pectorale]